jgi:beta-glucosidase
MTASNKLWLLPGGCLGNACLTTLLRPHLPDWPEHSCTYWSQCRVPKLHEVTATSSLLYEDKERYDRHLDFANTSFIPPDLNAIHMEKNDVYTDVEEKSSLIQKASRRSKLTTWCRKHSKIVTAVAIMILLLPLLGLLALRKTAADWTSPIVYPSPKGYGAGDWDEAFQKATAMVAKMTLAEMNNITIGVTGHGTGCVGVSGGAPRVGFPGFCLHDAGNGVRNTDGVNAYASGLHVGASWNSTLAYERAKYMGAEFKNKGVNVALGPVVGPIGRIAEGGRNWEGFGSDPYLNGILGAQSVIGLQESVIASVKHFIANEQETNRNPITKDVQVIASTSANIDDTTMHELYLWPFQDLVYAGAGCVMCSYNRINQTYGCENSKTTNGFLKGELDFQGFLVSDWNAQHSSDDSANAGLDMAMPTSSYWDNNQLVDAVNSGDVNKTRLIDMATRIIATWYQFGQDDPDFPKLGGGLPADLLQPHQYVDAKDPSSKPSLLQQAIEGHVLVKNTNKALPLSKPSLMSVFGYDATAEQSFTPGPQDLGAGIMQDFFAVNWQSINLNAAQLAELAGNIPLTSPPRTAKGMLFTGGGSGSNTPAYMLSPFDALQAQAYEDDTAVFYDFTSTDPNVAASSEACLVFLNAYAAESWDMGGLTDPDSDDLVNNVASKCKSTIVVIHNAGIRLVDAWIEHPNVTAVMFAHLPGQDAGRALIQLLYGEASPSGRLPYTVAKSEDDFGDLLGPCIDVSINPQCDFTEGVNIDYRGFLAREVVPRYEFGYGLTYSSFSYSNLVINVNTTATNNGTENASVYTDGDTDNSNRPDVGVGGLDSLFESAGNIQATITNTGEVAASEVAQLYIQTPSMTTRALRGFEKVYIQPGGSAQVTFKLRQKDVSSWDAEAQAWIVPKGSFQVLVGKSVLDVQLNGTFTT